jgi:glutamine synthetase
LVPGFEAPVMLAYSARNRSAAIRVPFTTMPKHKRIEIRYPDPAANPYLSFAATLMAGIDGIKKEIHPGEAMEKNLYKLSDEEGSQIPTLCTSLRQALDALQHDHEFLTRGDVFTQDLIEGFVSLKMADIKRLWSTTHPVEFDMYYSV